MSSTMGDNNSKTAAEAARVNNEATSEAERRAEQNNDDERETREQAVGSIANEDPALAHLAGQRGHAV